MSDMVYFVWLHCFSDGRAVFGIVCFQNTGTLFALTEKAKQEIEIMQPLLSESELLAKQRETTEAKLLLEKEGNPPLISLNDMRKFLATEEKEEIENKMKEKLDFIFSKGKLKYRRKNSYVKDNCIKLHNGAMWTACFLPFGKSLYEQQFSL